MQTFRRDLTAYLDCTRTLTFGVFRSSSAAATQEKEKERKRVRKRKKIRS